MKIKIIALAKILFIFIFFLIALKAHENFTAEERIDRGVISSIISFAGFAASFPLSLIHPIFYIFFSFIFDDISFDSYLSWFIFYLIPVFFIGYYQWFYWLPRASSVLNKMYALDLLKIMKNPIIKKWKI